MNSKLILAFAGGTVIGCAIGIPLGILYQKKKYKKEIDAISASYHDIFEKQRKEIEELSEREDSSLEQPASFSNIVVGSMDEDELIEAFGKNYAYNYNAHSKTVSDDPLMPKTDKATIKEPEPRDELETLHPVDSDEDIPEEEVLTEEEARYISGLKDSVNRDKERDIKPKIIKDEDYGTDGRYAESNLFYYPEDDILCDENNQEIGNPSTVVGDTLDKFDFRHNNQDHMCIRNFMLGLDYWIIKRDFRYVPDFN